MGNKGHWKAGQSGNPRYGRGGKRTHEFRERCRKLSKEKVLPLLEREIQKCIDDPTLPVSTAMEAANMVLRYSYAPVKDTAPEEVEADQIEAEQLQRMSEDDLRKMFEEAGSAPEEMKQ